MQLWGEKKVMLLSEAENDSKVQQSEHLEVLTIGQMENTFTAKATQTVPSHKMREKR